MPYPRELNLDKDVEEKLIEYLSTELQNHHAERQDYVDDLMRWQKDYWATPTTKIAKFPFYGAATIIIPLNAIAIEAIHARLMTMMFGIPQIVSAKAVSSQWELVEKQFERFMDYELTNNIKIEDEFNDCYLEAEKFGTCIAAVGYERKTKWAIREINGVEEEFEVVVRQGATVDSVSGARFWMPMHSKNPNDASWCAIEHSGTAYELMQFENGGLFRPGTIIDISEDKPAKMKNYLYENTTATTSFSTGEQFDQQQDELDKSKPVFKPRINWHEVKCAYDIDKTGRYKEIIAHFHLESRTLMSVRYNWNADLDRDISIGKYMPIEHRWRGIGICKMNEQFQREITTQHRQRLDNALLANMRMIVISRLSGYGPGESVFPGKMWFVDDMTHINTVQLGEIYPSAYQNEQSTLIYSQQRSGVNEVTLGMPQVGTPGTATADLARIQEGQKKFDFVFANLKRFSTDVIHKVAAKVQQFGPRQQYYYDTVENGQLVKQLFEMPEVLIKEGLLISFKAAGAQQNKIVDRQDWQQIAAFLQQYYTNLLQLAQLTGNQELMMAILHKAFLASNEGMRQILETYDARNIDRMLVTEIERIIGNVNNQQTNGSGANQGGSGFSAAVGGANPLDFLNSAFAGALPAGAASNGAI